LSPSKCDRMCKALEQNSPTHLTKCVTSLLRLLPNHLAGGGLPHNYRRESEAATPPWRWAAGCWFTLAPRWGTPLRTCKRGTDRGTWREHRNPKTMELHTQPGPQQGQNDFFYPPGS
jgi:hypothetical protein